MPPSIPRTPVSVFWACQLPNPCSCTRSALGRSRISQPRRSQRRAPLTRRTFLTSLLPGSGRNAPTGTGTGTTTTPTSTTTTSSSVSPKSAAPKNSQSPLASLASTLAGLPGRVLPPLPSLSPLQPLSPPPQTVTAHRVLPYPAAAVYELVADVSSYATFVPYCSESVVTEWTTYEAGSQTETTTGTTEAPVAGGKPGTRYPSRATLRVGFGAIETSYASTVVCHPGLGVVEALSGREARSALSPEQLRAAGHGNISRANTSVDTGSSRHDDDSLFLSLETCWTVRPMSSGRLESPVAPSPAASAAPGDQQQMRAVSEEWSDVSLRIRFRFASPLYAAVSAAAADSVAGVMIAAFERRASELLGKKGGRGI